MWTKKTGAAHNQHGHVHFICGFSMQRKFYHAFPQLPREIVASKVIHVDLFPE